MTSKEKIQKIEELKDIINTYKYYVDLFSELKTSQVVNGWANEIKRRKAELEI